MNAPNSSRNHKWHDVNPRLYDRLNALCSVILGIVLIATALLAVQPSMNPDLPQYNQVETPQ